jgi:hypothetical protein
MPFDSQDSGRQSSIFAIEQRKYAKANSNPVDAVPGQCSAQIILDRLSPPLSMG